ncbi:MAG: hypothetical protein FK733_06525 [Asgard group archaeon]|nr:hypothetical protein [Asgard group archaeon]
MFNRKNWIWILLVIVLANFLMTPSFGKGINNEEKEEMGLKNPLPPPPMPMYYHVYEDRLYFNVDYYVYQYDISNKNNITYLNETNIGSDYAKICYYENNMIVFTSEYDTKNDYREYKLDKYRLSGNSIEKAKTVEFIEEARIDLLCIDNEVILFGEKVNSTSIYASLFHMDLDQANPTKNIISINNETINYLHDIILEDNIIYLIKEKTILRNMSILIFNIENPSAPILASNHTIENLEPHFSWAHKEEEIFYICNRYNRAYAFNVTDINNLKKIGTFIAPGNQYQSVKIFHNYAIAIDGGDIVIYNITQIENSERLGDFTCSYGFEDFESVFAIFDDLIFSSHFYHYGMTILDWSNPEEIIELSITLPIISNYVGINRVWFIITCILPFFIISYKFSRQKIKKK